VKPAKPKPEAKPITAQPPLDGYQFAADVPYSSRDAKREEATHKETAPGCYWTPRRRGAP
jgi:hypothetical protein